MPVNLVASRQIVLDSLWDSQTGFFTDSAPDNEVISYIKPGFSTPMRPRLMEIVRRSLVSLWRVEQGFQAIPRWSRQPRAQANRALFLRRSRNIIDDRSLIFIYKCQREARDRAKGELNLQQLSQLTNVKYIKCNTYWYFTEQSCTDEFSRLRFYFSSKSPWF